jgi:hypothetical protein
VDTPANCKNVVAVGATESWVGGTGAGALHDCSRSQLGRGMAHAPRAD